MSAPSTASLLRLLGWLRWRLMLNAITRSGNRDLLERLSRATESALPLAVLVFLIPAALALGGVGVLTGWYLGLDPSTVLPLLQFVRMALLAITGLALGAPVIYSAGQQTPGIVRLLLLPIPRRVLYIAQALGGLADPWVLLAIALLLGLVVGLAARAEPLAAVLSLVAALGMLAVLLGLSALSTVCIQLLVRNRRRAEALALGGTLLVIALSLIPAALAPEHTDRTQQGHGRNPRDVPAWMSNVSAVVPSELYTRAVQDAATGERAGSAAASFALFGWAALAHGLTWPLYLRLLGAPTSTGGVSPLTNRRATVPAIPVVGVDASAIAINFLRLALRTPRGRSTMLAPIVMMVVFAVMFTLRGQTIPVGPFQIGGGFTLAIFSAVIAVMSLGPLLFNQFAVDGAGLTLTFLAPVSDREVLRGKATGGFLIAAGPMLIGFVAGALTGAHAVWLWIALALGVVAVFLVYAPVAALLAMILPRAVDLSAIGKASNAHQGAALLGLVGFAAATAPPSLLAMAADRMWRDDRAVAIALAIWLIVAALLSMALFRIAERVLRDRRENLVMVAQGR